MRLGGTDEPRRNVEDGGLLTRWAQSSGEWPGASSTFSEERDEAGREEAVGASEREGVCGVWMRWKGVGGGLKKVWKAHDWMSSVGVMAVASGLRMEI